MHIQALLADGNDSPLRQLFTALTKATQLQVAISIPYRFEGFDNLVFQDIFLPTMPEDDLATVRRALYSHRTIFNTEVAYYCTWLLHIVSQFMLRLLFPFSVPQ
jgi:hypothetical protein